MSVTKKSGFAGPYRSQTFRLNYDEIVGRNGVMTMNGEVTESAGIISIPPFTFIQQGLIVTSDSVKTVNKPSMTGPYFLVISSPTTIQVDDLVISFAASPRDVQANEVLVAEWDGNEWRQLPFVSIDEVIKATEQDRLDYGWGGPVNGLITSVSGLSYKNTKGIIIDRNGMKTRLDEDAYLTQYADDPEATWTRVDRIAYRRQQDGDRVGVRKTLLGGTYTLGPQVLSGPQIKTNSAYHPRTKVAVDNANIGYVMTVEGFGASFTLWLTRLLADRSGVDFATTQVSGVTATTDEIDFAIDPVSGDCHFVYVNSGNIYFIRTDKNANVLNGPVAIDTQSQPCSNPRILRDSSGKFLITYQALLAPLNNQLYFASCDNTGATITGAKRIVNTATNIINQDMFVTPDLYLYIAYEDQTLGKIYYDIYDDIGNAITVSPTWISQNVVSTTYGTNTDNASKPKIRVSDSRDVFVTFLQVRGGLTGIAIFKNEGQAYSPDLLTVGETFTDYDFQVSDLLNDLLFYVNEPTSGSYRVMVSGEGEISQSAVVLNSEQIGTQAHSLSMVFDRTGSLLISKVDASTGTYTDIGTPQSLAVIGPATLVGTSGTISLAANQVMFMTASLTHTPVIGEQMTIAGATNVSNNISQVVQNVQTADYNSTGDATIVTLPANYLSAEDPVVSATAQFAEPDGMAVESYKATSEQDQARALRMNTLPCDVLLSRIVCPGPIILNYLQNPVFSGGVSTQAQQVAIHGESPVDWEGTSAGNFTITTDFGIMDLLNYVDYTVQAGSYAMAEDEALYVKLDGVNTVLTPIVANIAVLPWSEPIQVLGFVKGGDFNPVLLSIGGGETLSPGEEIVIGSDLPTPIRNRLGITSDTTFEAYASTTEIGANDTYPTAISKLDKAAGQTRIIDLIDLVSTSLPTGPSASIDGVSLTNGMKVVFTKAPIAGAYTVSGVGTSITFTPFNCFKGLNTPFNGAMIRVAQGTSYVSTLWTYASTAWKALDVSEATHEATGVVDRTESTLSFIDGSRTFSITPVSDHFDFYIHGVLFRKDSAQSLVLPNTDGVKFIYFDSTGTLQYQTSFDETLLKDKAYVATVYWNVSTAKGMLADERHGMVMDWLTHSYLHLTQGAKIQSGFAPGSYTLVGTGASDADCEMAVSDGVFRDEDITISIQDGVQQDLAPIAQIPVFYRSGVSGVWAWDAPTNFPLKAGTLRPKFNNPSGWTTDDASADGKFVAMFVLVTNFVSNPVIAIMGQAEYDTLSDAQAGAIYQNLSMGDFITQESKLAYRLIFEVDSTYTNTPKASLRHIQDYRAGVDLQGTPAQNVTDHGLLTGLGDPDHGPTAVTTSGVTKDGGFSSSDTDLEQALDTLNKTLGQLRLKTHPSNTKRLIVTGAKRILNDGTTLVQKLRSFVMSFDGAQIDFATKQIFEADGITPFGGGATFAYTFPTTGQWKWLAISLTTSSMSAQNEVIPKFLITEATSTSGSQSTAPKATFAGGTGIGEVAVQGSGSDIAALTTANINSIGVAGGGGSGGASPKIVGGGTVSSRFVNEGFSIGTGFDQTVTRVAVQPDGKILVGGYYTVFNGNIRNRLVQLNPDGSEDTAFYTNLGTGFGNTVYRMALQPDGKILVSGFFNTFNGNGRVKLVRLYSNGFEDTDFYTNLGTSFDLDINSLAVQSDGKILVGGSFGIFNGNTRKRLIRLNSDGTEDTAFYANLGNSFDFEVSAIAVQSDGKILVGGMFTMFNLQIRNGLIRLNSDGTEDTAFYANLGTGFWSPVYALAVQSNGKILVGGTFNTFNGNTRNRLVRLNSDGTEDTAFYTNLSTGFNNNAVSSLEVQPDGKILVGGSFTTFKSNTRNRLVRLGPDGTEDTSFYLNLGLLGFNSAVFQTALQSDGRILVAGAFFPFMSEIRNRLVRLNSNGTEETGVVVSGAQLSYTSDFYVEVPGLAYTDNTIQTALSPITFTADQQAAYVVPNSSAGGPALPVTVTTLPNVPSDAVILARREGTEVIVGSSSTRLSNGESKKLYAGVSDQLLSSLPATSNADNTGQLRLLANSTPNKKVNVSAVSKIVPDGTEYGIQIKNLLLSFGGAVIDFSTGVITDQLGGALGVNFTPATIAASQYRWYSVTLVPANIEANGKISGQLVVIAAASDGATAALAPRAAFATGIQLGQVVVQESGGSIAVIPQSNIVQLSAGGSGSGTGDANSLMEDIKARLRDGPFMWATPNVISLQGKTLIDAVNSTATYDVANSWYDIDIGQSLRSIQQFGAQFLASTRDCQDVEVNLGYDTTGVDPNPSVYVSRNGGNAWQQVTMDRIGASNKLRGSLTFAAEADQVVDTYAIANADGAALLNNTNYKAIAQKFEPTSKVLIRKLTFRFEKVGSPTGNVNLKIIKDVAGSPSADLNDIVYATTMSASSFAAGVNNRSFTMNVPLPSASYWFVFDTDDLYKAGYTGSDNIRIYQDSSTPTATRAKGYNTSWVTQVFAVVYVVEGLTYDLRLRVDSSINNSKLLGSGIFFGKQSPGDVVTSSTIKQMRTTFSGSDNVYSFTLPFLPDPDFLRVYDITSGQVYLYPAFDISANVVSFISGTFFVPGQNITLLFDQSQGSGYDNSDRNRALMAENGLGGQNGNDASSPGVGIKLRSPNGQLWHIVVQDNGAILTTPITG